MAGGLEIAFSVDLIEELLRLEVRQREDDSPAAVGELRRYRDRVF